MTQSFDEWFYPTASPKAAWDAGQQSKQAEIDGLKAQLIRAGYVDNGGVLLRPPLGETPRFDLLDAKQAEIDALQSAIEKALERANHAHIGYGMLYAQFEDVIKILKSTKLKL